MSKVYDALGVARYILKYSNGKGYDINIIKLQNILFYVQGAFLVYRSDFDRSEQTEYFNQIKSYAYGVFVKDVYRYYRNSGVSNIKVADTKVKVCNDCFEFEEVNAMNYVKDEDKEVINAVVDSLVTFSEQELTNRVRDEKIIKECKKGIISLSEMEKYFQKNKHRLFGLNENVLN